jgi:hypothetical protein
LVAFSIVISLLAVVASIWGARWMRVVISVVLFLFAADRIFIGYMNAPRHAIGPKIANGMPPEAFFEGVRALSDVLLPFWGALFVVCCGFLALGVGRKR